MKKLLFALTAGLALALSPAALAQAKKKEPAKPADPAAPAKPAADAKPADAKPADAKAAKPIPMNSRADELDAAGKTFTQINKDGKKVKHVVTDTTVIKQGEADAKFEDIKQGDTVAGLRVKKNADGTEYEVVKITKFGAPAKKADAKPADAKPAEKKGK